MARAPMTAEKRAELRAAAFARHQANYVPQYRGYGSPCWSWQGSIFKRYPVIPAPGRMFAHRAHYEAVHGPIPDGLTIDHLCFNPDCVNPAHMEVVTRGENARRGNLRRRTFASTAVNGTAEWFRDYRAHKIATDPNYHERLREGNRIRTARRAARKRAAAAV